MPIRAFQAALDRPLHRQQITVDDVAAFERAADEETKANGAVDPAVVERLAQQYRRFVAGDVSSVQLEAPVVDRLSALLVRLGAVVPTSVERRVLARDFAEKTKDGEAPYTRMYWAIDAADEKAFALGYDVVARAVQGGMQLGDDWAELMHRAALAKGGAPFVAKLASLGISPNTPSDRTHEKFPSALHAALAQYEVSRNYAWPHDVPSGDDKKAIVGALLAAGAHPSGASMTTSPLHLLARWRGDHAAAVEIGAMLLDAGADPNARTKNPDTSGLMHYGDTPLSLARRCGNKALVDLLIARGARDVSPEDEAALAAAKTVDEAKKIAARGTFDAAWVWSHALIDRDFDAGRAQLLLDAGVSPHAHVPWMWSKDASTRPLLHAIVDFVDPKPALLQVLRAAGVDMNQPDDDGATALHKAIAGKTGGPTSYHNVRLALVGALVELGADPNAPDAAGDRPLHRARRTPFAGVIQTLVDKGADRELRNAAGLTPLADALLAGDHWAVQQLLLAGADPNTTTPNGGPIWSALLARAAASPTVPQKQRDALESLLFHPSLKIDLNDAMVQGALDVARKHPVLKFFVAAAEARAQSKAPPIPGREIGNVGGSPISLDDAGVLYRRGLPVVTPPLANTVPLVGRDLVYFLPSFADLPGGDVAPGVGHPMRAQGLITYAPSTSQWGRDIYWRYNAHGMDARYDVRSGTVSLTPPKGSAARPVGVSSPFMGNTFDVE